MTKPLILISNDDGIRAEGIQHLAKVFRKTFRRAEIFVVAPEGQQSACSHSLTLHRPLRIEKYSPFDYSVDGTPTDCILLAVDTILPRKPDLVVSGINGGANLGEDVHYSGTVSAAVEGSLLGIRSMALSLVIKANDKKFHYETASSFAVKLSKKVLQGHLPANTIFNVNVPNLPSQKVKGYRFTRLGSRNFGDVIFEKTDPRGKKYYWIGGDDRTFENIPGSDGNAFLEKYISVTPLQVDLTHDSLLKEIQHWKI